MTLEGFNPMKSVKKTVGGEMGLLWVLFADLGGIPSTNTRVYGGV